MYKTLARQQSSSSSFSSIEHTHIFIYIYEWCTKGQETLILSDFTRLYTYMYLYQTQPNVFRGIINFFFHYRGRKTAVIADTEPNPICRVRVFREFTRSRHRKVYIKRPRTRLIDQRLRLLDVYIRIT